MQKKQHVPTAPFGVGSSSAPAAPASSEFSKAGEHSRDMTYDVRGIWLLVTNIDNFSGLRSKCIFLFGLIHVLSVLFCFFLLLHL